MTGRSRCALWLGAAGGLVSRETLGSEASLVLKMKGRNNGVE